MITLRDLESGRSRPGEKAAPNVSADGVDDFNVAPATFRIHGLDGKSYPRRSLCGGQIRTPERPGGAR